MKFIDFQSHHFLSVLYEFFRSNSQISEDTGLLSLTSNSIANPPGLQFFSGKNHGFHRVALQPLRVEETKSLNSII